MFKTRSSPRNSNLKVKKEFRQIVVHEVNKKDTKA